MKTDVNTMKYQNLKNGINTNNNRNLLFSGTLLSKLIEK